MANGGPDLQMIDLRIEYNSGGYLVRPIDGLNATVLSGELAVLLGASGCGKTTLLSALAAILTPAGGTIRFGDIEVNRLRGGALTDYRRHTVGIVFQVFNLIPSLSALENVAVPLRSAGVRRRPATARAEQLLADVGLADRVGHRPGDLSGGQQQRVAIARALAHDPPLVLADEPTAHLDYIQVESVLRLLRDIARPGRTVVVATHDDRLLPLADRVVELSRPATNETAAPERRELSPGQVLFEQGDPGDLVYFIEVGHVELFRRRADGSEEPIQVFGPGDYFGELAPMFALRRSATARAVDQVIATGYTVHDFRARVRPT